MTVTHIITQVPIGPDLAPLAVLTGTVTDGGKVLRLFAVVIGPDGQQHLQPVAHDGANWSFGLQAASAGEYTVWIMAEDMAGNQTTAGPFPVYVLCTDAAPVVTGLSVEPIAGQPLSLTVTIVISSAGPEPLPAGTPVFLHDGIAPIGTMSTTAELGAGEWQALSLTWSPQGEGDYLIAVTPGPAPVLPHGCLCASPDTATFPVSVRAQALYAGWTLVGPRGNPGNTDVEAVQRGIDGDYSALLGYDGGLLAYYPDRPAGNPLTTVDGMHGYWVRTITPTLPPGDPLWGEPAATWWMAGQVLPENLPLALDEGMNLAGFLPRLPMTVTTALAGIDGQYEAVLGFERTAASYYPELDPSYNTLANMAPGYGFWISATQAVTLAYPVSIISTTLPVSATQMAADRQQAIVAAEWQYGVQATYQWANFYGPATLSDGTPVPVGTVVVAVSPNNIVCGATTVWQAGQFGLLACYGDDPNTAVDEGAQPGDVIDLWIPSDNTLIGSGTWTGHGGLWLVAPGAPPPPPPPPPPVVDLVITKVVTPTQALPGDMVTYTITYWNAGDAAAQAVVLTDVVPFELSVTGVDSWGAPITLISSTAPYVWQVADFEPGAGGIITLTALLSPELTGTLAITNTAVISTPLEAQPANNLAQALLEVIEGLARLWRAILHGAL
jgi:uncharacterized repeat protein (TIGR01451 family)